MGLDAVFGAREDEVEFMPDIGDRIHFELDGAAVDGGGFLQSYRLDRRHGDAATSPTAVLPSSKMPIGKGRTLLIGTNPSVAYYRTQGKANGAFFAELLRMERQEAARNALECHSLCPYPQRRKGQLPLARQPDKGGADDRGRRSRWNA